jgi:DNA-binding MarR family transcriptional regulator
MPTEELPTLAEYRALAELRYQLRRFLHFSEAVARRAGLEPQQHQLLLALKGLPAPARPTIGTLAQRLCVAHHTAVALVDKLEAAGLTIRVRSERDRREVLLAITAEGERRLDELSSLHWRHLLTLAPDMLHALQQLLDGDRGARFAQRTR